MLSTGTTTPSLVDPSRITSGPSQGRATDTSNVGSLLVQQDGCESDFQSIQRAQKEMVYKSRHIKLGKSYIRGHEVPRAASGIPDYCHGIKSNTCNETTKSLLFPEMGAESRPDEVEDQYQNKSKRSFDPGEQLKRYELGICDPSTIYGKRGESTSTHGSSNVHAVLNPSPTVAENSCEEQLELLAEGKDIQMVKRRMASGNNSNLPPDHIYGIVSKSTDWGTKECLAVNCYTEEQEGHLSKYHQEDDNRVFGIPSIRNDIPWISHQKRSIAEKQNYGDEAGIGPLMKPSPLRCLGLEEGFSTERPENELLEIFRKTGYQYREEEFRQVFLRANKGKSSGRASISAIQEVIRSENNVKELSKKDPK